MGGNEHGQLGLGHDSDKFEYPPKQIKNIVNICWTQVECGGEHTVALSSNGEVFTWGRNSFGELGHGDTKERHVPTKVESLSGKRIVKVACGTNHTVAVTATGELLTWYVAMGHHTAYIQFQHSFVILLSKGRWMSWATWTW